MSERDDAWSSYAAEHVEGRKPVLFKPVFDNGFNAGHASAEAKYTPALSAAEAERDLARGNELAIAAMSAAYRTYRETRDLHELARAVGQILNGPDDVQPENAQTIVERPGDSDG